MYTELDLNKYLSAGYKVQRLFVDPSGCHILVSAVHKDREKDPEREDNNAELIYVHVNSAKPRQVLSNFFEEHRVRIKLGEIVNV